MTKGAYIHLFRRRRVGKTDYRNRKGMIANKAFMFAVRISNKYVYGQILEATPNGDLTLCSASSRDLRKQYGWAGSCKNLPAAYLVGFLLGKRAKAKEVSGAVVYSGVNRFVYGSRIASVISGAKDAGLELEADDEVLPEEERLKGGHIESYAKKVGEDGSQDAMFSGLKKHGFDPTKYSSYFEETKMSINSKNNGSPSKEK